MKIQYAPLNHDYFPAMRRCKAELSYYGIKFKLEDIRSSSRKDDLCYIRALMAIILRQDGLTLAEIGYALNRDHTTVIHFLKNYRGQSKYARIFAATKKEILKSSKSKDKKAQIRLYEHQIKLIRAMIKAIDEN